MPAPITVHTSGHATDTPDPRGGFAAVLSWDQQQAEVTGGNDAPIEVMRLIAAVEALRVMNNTPALDNRPARIHTASTTIHTRAADPNTAPPAPSAPETIHWDELLAEAEGRVIQWLQPDRNSPRQAQADATAIHMTHASRDDPGFFINLPSNPTTPGPH